MKTHHKNGLSASIAPRTMRPRLSRHGKLLTDVYTTTVPGEFEKSIRQDKVTGEYVPVLITIRPTTQRAATPDEIAARRNSVPRATGPTTTGWRKNESESKGKKVKVQS